MSRFIAAVLALVSTSAFAAVLTAAERKAALSITAAEMLGHTRFLASDLLEGRAPASTGDRLAQAYIAAQMEAVGLEPGAPDGTWLQQFDIVGIHAQVPKTARFRGEKDKLELRFLEEFMASSGVQAQEAEIDGAELVFVGYGIVAPEYQWDDFKGVDLKGKVLMIMNNDPDHSAAGDAALFEGRRRLYYGRWDYKYKMAAQQGAAGAIIVHTEPSAGYKWQVVQTGWSGEQFELPAEGEPRIQIAAWTTEDASRRLAALGGHDLDRLRASAEKRDFRPVPLGVTMDLKLENRISRKQTANVIGKLPGTSKTRDDEAVFYTAHYDHLGVNPEAKAGEDAIYNGALDNASGVAQMLAIARAMATVPHRARSVYFAAVAAEEQGLLGSRYLCAHPPVPPGRIAADINIDEANVWGRTTDIVQIGKGKTTLDRWIEALAAVQGRKVVGDQAPDKGTYYRSDQFSFAHIGVPGAFFNPGSRFEGKSAEWGRDRKKEFTDRDYHQPSDEVRDDWDLSGAVEDAQFLLWLGLKIAEDPRMPGWTPGDEFEATRKKALAEVRDVR